jgi:branched-chain amino acid transport system permease protein
VAVDVGHAQNLLPLLQEGRPDAAGWMKRRVVAGLIAAFVIASPILPHPDSWALAVWVGLGMIYVIVGLSINILIGHAGQVSLGHQAFVGVGAITGALGTTSWGLPFLASVAVAAASGAIAALLLGFVALRLSGLYLALITLAYGEIAERVIFNIPAVAGGGAGIQVTRPSGFESNEAIAYLCMVFVAIALFLDWRLMKSKAGRAIIALRDNEIAARSVGINTTFYKLFAFVLSGAMAGVAGALLAPWARIVNASTFDFTLALTFVLMAAVGGLESRAGIFMASAFFAIFPLAFGGLQVWVLIVGPVLLLITLIAAPGGMGQQIRPITNWLAGGKFSLHGDSHGVQSGGSGVRP